MTGGSVSIVLPIYKQAASVESLVREFEDGLSLLPVGHETILVVNGPDDGSVAVCRRLAGELPNVRFFLHEPSGWGNAVQRGLEEAAGDILCYTNSARTDIRTLALMINAALRLPGVVIKANRKTRDSVWRHLGSLVYNIECRALFDLSNFDINGTPKVFPRSCGKLLELTRKDDLLDVEFLAVCREEGYLVLEIPVLVGRRRSGKSTTNVRSAVRMYWGALRLRNLMRREGRITA